MEKVDFKKKYKEIYKPSSKKPAIVNVPPLHYITLSGQGNPNTSKEFSNAIGALYALSYTISMSYKGNDLLIPDFYNFVVPPLEGVWDIVDDKKHEQFNKDNLKWTIGIMMPEFVTQDIFERAKLLAYNKKKDELIKDVKFDNYDDGLCCTMMHLGSYDDEPATFKMMEAYAKENGYARIEKNHREIYLSDFRKVEPDKLKTVLRFKVKKD